MSSQSLSTSSNEALALQAELAGDAIKAQIAGDAIGAKIAREIRPGSWPGWTASRLNASKLNFLVTAPTRSPGSIMSGGLAKPFVADASTFPRLRGGKPLK